jgi:hypothetical protein
LLNALKKEVFDSYWFETGTPSFLVQLLKQSNYNLNNLQEEQQSADMLNSIDSMSKDPIPVIYQSGYLTIKGYDEEFQWYRLGFPNKEVETGFVKYLLPLYAPVEEKKTEFFIGNFINDIRQGNPMPSWSACRRCLPIPIISIAGKMELYFRTRCMSSSR